MKYFVPIMVLLWLACTPDPERPTLEQIVGQWQVHQAKRNNRPTKTLAGAYFVFYKNGNMTSNLPLYESPEPWNGAFELAADTIRQTRPSKLQYLVKTWSDSSLVLEFTTRGVPFELTLIPMDSIPSAPEPNVYE